MSFTSTQGVSKFQYLPREILWYIMEHFNSPDDVLALIGAHRLSLNVFLEHRRQITRFWIHDLLSRFEKLLCPSFLLAARLRHCRTQPKSLRIGAIVKKIADAAAPYITSGTSMQYQLHGLSLSALSSLLSVGDDAEWLVANYAPYAQKRLFDSETDIFSNERTEVVLSEKEWGRFLKASFHFESYCQMFFREEVLLFERDQIKRSVMFRKRMCKSGQQSTGIEMFYSILFYVYHQHWSIFRNVAKHLDMLIRQLNSPVSSQAYVAKARIPVYGDNLYIFLSRFRTMSRHGHKRQKYLHYLASQGLRMLRNLQRMSIEEQAIFTLPKFFEVSRSKDPAVYITADPRGFHLGTCGPNSWLPWQYLDDQFTDADDYEQWTGTWASAERFWDQHADDADNEEKDDDMEVGESEDEDWYR
ncbi:hypothetical protein F53441_11996 [Fusarium austroafricanum]|uniref:Uncharacterized protein n=1 Tax=Fusarium austroafricanum TaxID=2364996 RepID=A0A8H4JYX1_9HYPO|nr:hypothetical protein F53441_11996 [Fusarium austroafricanum]